MTLSEFLARLAATTGALSVSRGIVTFEDGSTFEAAAAVGETVLHVADWRIQDGDPSSVATELAAPGRLHFHRAGYGAVIDGVAPDGRVFSVGMEFDAGAFKLLVFPPHPDTPQEDTRDESVVQLVVQPNSVIVHSGYGAQASRFEPEGRVTPCACYDGQQVMDRARIADDV